VISTPDPWVEIRGGPPVWSVPAEGSPHVCPRCLGPKKGEFSLCRGCELTNGVPPSLERVAVPITAALNPSSYYSALWTYKESEWIRYGRFLAALTALFIRSQRRRLEEVLGGVWDAVAVVPSTRVPHERQRLRQVADNVQALREGLQPQLLRHNGTRIGRSDYKPEAFDVVSPVDGRRIFLLEDSWITGSHPLSAAGALLGAGARSVVVVPIARVVRQDYWGQHPYRAGMKLPWSPDTWPRA
jgi:predicted amidophosphoribosyltransferase